LVKQIAAMLESKILAKPSIYRTALALPLRRAHMQKMAELIIRRGLEEPDTVGTFTPHRPERPSKLEGGRPFRIVSDYAPAGDQPTAIRELVETALTGE